MQFVFIRHSQSQINPDIPITTWGLSEEGRARATKLQTLQCMRSLDGIYASLQPKALETAILATKNLGIPLQTDDRLTESTSFTNKFIHEKELHANLHAYFSDHKRSFYDGETFEQALLRFTRVLTEISANTQLKSIGIVSHGAILSSFASQFHQADPYDILESLAQPDIALFDWDTKTFTTFFGEMHYDL